jgi:transketolase
MKLTDLEKRVLEISYKKKLSHIGSCLIVLPLLEAIYDTRGEDDPVIMDAAHSSLALYCVLEKKHGFDAEKLFEQHGVHCNRDPEHFIWASGGSLGHGLGIGLGMALADPDKIVYVLTTDGASSEGSWWEALRNAAELKISNLVIVVIANGYGAYKEIEQDRLEWRVQSFMQDNFPKVSFVRVNMDKYPKWLQGLDAHYVVMDDEKYKEINEH